MSQSTVTKKTGPVILIVGGVAGGATAAARARRCNEQARIIIFEKDEYVSFANCGLPYHIGGEISNREALLVATPELFERRFEIEINTRHLVAAIDRDKKQATIKNLETGEEFTQSYDKLILTPGASPLVPPIPGVKSNNVFTLRNMADMDAIISYVSENQVQQPVVIGAGFIGLEMVEQLHSLGQKVSLVELQTQVLPPLDPEMAKMIEEELLAHAIDLHLGDGIESLETNDSGKATAVLLASGTKLPTDMVILGIGVRPNTSLATEAHLELGEMGGVKVNDVMQTSDPDIYAAGDVVEYMHGVTETKMRIPLAGPANKAGRIAGEHAASGKAQPMTPPVGTAVVRVFGLSAGVTGLSTKMANHFGKENRSVLVTHKHHAGYFPGAETLTLKLIYDPTNGRVLGASAIGRAGVDKRLDVLATTLHFKGTVHDLAGLDLAYAPPFGSAKDPVHMAAFAAGNDLAGNMQVTEADADLTGKQVVDLRTTCELDTMSLENSIAIPLDDLRSRLSELDPSRETVVLCHSGLRAYIGGRILMQNGFSQVSNLTGGISMRRRAVPASVSSKNEQTCSSTSK